MVDEHSVINITEKVVNDADIGLIEQGESDSQLLTFQINRYYDGEDLSTKLISFIYLRPNEEETKIENNTTSEVEEKTIKFTWLLSPTVCAKVGKVQVVIRFADKTDPKNYTLKTNKFTLNVLPSLSYSAT